MMTKNKLTYTLAACTVLIATQGLGQESTDQDTMKTSITIVSGYEPTIANPEKLEGEPQLDTIRAKELDFKYTTSIVNYETEFNPDTIKPAKLKREPLSKLYRAYAKAGIGNYLNQMGELHINSLRSRDMIYGLDFTHLGSATDIKNYENSTFNQQNASAYVTKLSKFHAIGGKINWQRGHQNYYGYAPDYLSNETSLGVPNSTFNTIDVSANLKSFYKDTSMINYSFNAGYRNTMLSDGNEQQILFKSKFRKQIDNELATVDFNADILMPYNQSTNTLVNLTPSFKGTGDFKFQVALPIWLEVQDETKIRFYPKAHIEYNILKDVVVPYAGVSGGMKRNSFYQFYQQNNWIYEQATIKNTNERINAYLGIRGALSSKLTFNVLGQFQSLTDSPFYVNRYDVDETNELYGNYFDVVYDSVKINSIKGEIHYKMGDKFNITAAGQFNDYQTKQQAMAWHTPKFKGWLTGRMDLQDKIVFTTDFVFMTKQYAPSNNSFAGEQVADGVYAIEMDPIFDINLGVEYRYNRKISGFLQLNNIASQAYQRYNFYPTQQFNIMFGFTYGFWAK